jgi:glycosyltransferase involved in cell wall biosynthesis
MPVRALPFHRLGGLELHTVDLAAALTRRGHTVTLVTSSHPQGDARSEPTPGVEALHLPSGPPGDYSAAFFRAMEPFVARLDGAQRFDLIHAQEFAGLFLAPRRGRFACTIHGTMFSETQLDRRYFARLTGREKAAALWRNKARIALHPFFLRMIGRADLLVCDSAYTRREVARIRPAAAAGLHMVPLGVDSARYAPAPAAAARTDALPLTVAMLGRVQRMKGAEAAVRAVLLARSRGAPVRLIVGGAGEDVTRLAVVAQESGDASGVEFRGRIAPGGVSPFFCEADLFLFPDLTQPAFGLVAVEAMLHGLPVVGARSGAIPEVVPEEAGWLYDPWNTAELAALLCRLAGDRAAVAAKAPRARGHAAHFTADLMAERTETAYLSLAG